MFGVAQILGASARRSLPALAIAALLAGCGQKGPLLLPSGTAAAGRASLPDTLFPDAVRNAPANDATTRSVRPASAGSAPAGTPLPTELPPTGTVSPGHTDR
jgi:predicted small lipoprotein YifL